MNNLPDIGGKQSQSTSLGDGGGIKMKSQLSRDSSSSKPTSPQDEQKKPLFSPHNGTNSKMSNFFNTKGPIKPASMLPTQAMVNGPIIPVGSNAF